MLAKLEKQSIQISSKLGVESNMMNMGFQTEGSPRYTMSARQCDNLRNFQSNYHNSLYKTPNLVKFHMLERILDSLFKYYILNPWNLMYWWAQHKRYDWQNKRPDPYQEMVRFDWSQLLESYFILFFHWREYLPWTPLSHVRARATTYEQPIETKHVFQRNSS